MSSCPLKTKTSLPTLEEFNELQEMEHQLSSRSAEAHCSCSLPVRAGWLAGCVCVCMCVCMRVCMRVCVCTASVSLHPKHALLVYIRVCVLQLPLVDPPWHTPSGDLDSGNPTPFFHPASTLNPSKPAEKLSCEGTEAAGPLQGTLGITAEKRCRSLGFSVGRNMARAGA